MSRCQTFALPCVGWESFAFPSGAQGVPTSLGLLGTLAGHTWAHQAAVALIIPPSPAALVVPHGARDAGDRERCFAGISLRRVKGGWLCRQECLLGEGRQPFKELEGLGASPAQADALLHH